MPETLEHAAPILTIVAHCFESRTLEQQSVLEGKTSFLSERELPSSLARHSPFLSLASLCCFHTLLCLSQFHEYSTPFALLDLLSVKAPCHAEPVLNEQQALPFIYGNAILS